MQWIKQYFQDLKNRANYQARYIFVLFVVLAYTTHVIIAIISYGNNASEQQNAEQHSIKILTQHKNRGVIVDRNNIVLADNVLINTINISPAQNFQLAGFDDINSVWRVKKTCSKSQKITNSCWKFLANQAKQGIANNTTKNKFVQRVSLDDIVANTININPLQLHTYLINTKQNCLSTDKKCSKYKIIATNLLSTSSRMKNLHTLKKERFLVCKNKTSQLGRFDKIINKFFTWIVQPKKTQSYIKCYAQKIQGVGVENKYKRFYPSSPATTPLIGSVNRRGKGVFGIERDFDEFLKKQTKKYTIKKSSNSWVNNTKVLNFDSNTQNKLTLTIDSKVQFELFNAIKQSVDKYKAHSGAGIILNPNGEIIAMTSYPTSDVNKGINGADNYSHFINRALSDDIDTASTIKPLTILTALETGVITQDEMIDISTGEGIQEFKVDPLQNVIAIPDIIRRSHGLGAIKIGKKIDNADFYNYLSLLGFGKPLWILPKTENVGILRNFYDWSSVDKKRLSFGGYGVINTTLAQLARSYLVFLNNGKIKNLKLFKNTKNSEHQVFSPQNVEYVTNAMALAVESGTGKQAKLDTIIAAGKTGTAQLLINGKYSNSKHNTLFAGFAPKDNPKYLMLVNIKNPNGRGYSGGSVAAPVFKKVMDNILAKDF